MPKQRKVWKDQTGNIHRDKVCTKFRIGTRKSGKSALLMTSDELKDVLNDSNKKRYHAKARTVLKNRGIEVEWPENLVKDHQATLADLAADMGANSCG